MLVSRLEISTRLKNILFENGVDTVEDIMTLGPKNLLSGGELAQKSLAQILWSILIAQEPKEAKTTVSKCVMFLRNNGYTITKPITNGE